MRIVKYSSLVNWVLILFLCMNIVIVPIRGFLESNQVVGARYLDELIFVIFMGFSLLNFIIISRVHLNRIILWIIILAFWSLLIALINDVPMKIALMGIALILKPLIIFFTFSSVYLRKSSLESLLRWLENFFVMLVSFSLLYTLIFEMILKMNLIPGNIPGSHRLGIPVYRSFFVHPGVFGDMMLFSSLFFYAKFLYKRTMKHFIFTVLAVLGLLLSARMKTLIFFPLGIMLLFFLKNTKGLKINRKAISKIFIITAVSIVLLFAVIFVLQDPLKNYFTVDSEAVRTQLLLSAIKINFDSFGMGKGPGMFGSSISVTQHYSPLYYEYGIASLRGASPEFSAFITDQWWAWYLGEIGLIGFFIFIFALLLLLVKLYRASSIACFKTNDRFKSLANLAVLGLIYAIITGFADANLTRSPTGYLLMMLSGLVLSISSAGKRSEEKLATITE